MALETPRDIKRHFDSLKADRSTWESLWDEVADYGLARRSFTNTMTEQGEGKRTSALYDNTMMVGNDLLASGLHNLLTSTANRWFHIEPVDRQLLKVQEFADWFAMAEEILAMDLGDPDAGFHPQIAEVYNDIAAFGNAAISTMKKSGGGLWFQAMPLSETYIDEGPDARINMIFRYYRLTALQFRSRYGETGDDSIDHKIEAMLKQSNAGRSVEVLQSLIPNPIFDDKVSFGPRAHRITSKTIHYQSEREIETANFREMPIAFARWNKDPGELYARGPGIQALSDSRMLQEMGRTTLSGAQKAVDPPMMVPDNGFITQLDMSPAGLTVYRAGTQDPVRPLYERGMVNPDLGVEMMRHVQTNVRNAYHYDLLQMIQDPRMTATQVLEISSRAQQILSPIIGRIQTELLQPLLNRAFSLEMRSANRFPPLPRGLGGQGYRIRFVSPIQRAQRSNEAQALLQAMNSVIQLGQIEPSALDTLDSDRIARFLFSAWGVPPELLRDPQRVVEIRRARAQQQARIEQFGMMTEGAKAAAPLVKAIGSGAKDLGMQEAFGGSQGAGAATEPAAA
jgi:hypothetical protein